jgi:hypothetical protein
MFATSAWVLLAVALLLALLALVWPRRLHLAFSLLLLVIAFGALDSFEL